MGRVTRDQKTYKAGVMVAHRERDPHYGGQWVGLRMLRRSSQQQSVADCKLEMRERGARAPWSHTGSQVCRLTRGMRDCTGLAVQQEEQAGTVRMNSGLAFLVAMMVGRAKIRRSRRPRELMFADWQLCGCFIHCSMRSTH